MTPVEHIIVSDLHLGQTKPAGKTLWKKYEERQFAATKPMVAFLRTLKKRRKNVKFDIVFNGDVFDFDQVTIKTRQFKKKIQHTLHSGRLNTTKEASLRKAKIIMRHHHELFKVLGEYVANGHTVTFIRGNHDIELSWNAVKNVVRSTIQRYAQKKKATKKKKGVVQFFDWFYYKKNTFYIEHGNQYDPHNVIEFPLATKTHYNSIYLPHGSVIARTMAGRMGFMNPYNEAQYAKTGIEYIRHYLKYHRPEKQPLVKPWLIGAAQSIKGFMVLPKPFHRKQKLYHEQAKKSAAKQSGLTIGQINDIEALQPNPYAKKKAELFSLMKFDLLLFAATSLIALLVLTITQAVNYSIWLWIPIGILLGLLITVAIIVARKQQALQYPSLTKRARKIAKITKVRTVIFGHTHCRKKTKLTKKATYFNTGTWSPAFYDVECARPVEGRMSFVWIKQYKAELYEWGQNSWKKISKK